MLHSLQNKEREISDLTKELNILKREINNSERIKENDLNYRLPPTIRNIIIDIINSSNMPIRLIVDAPITVLQKRLKFDREKYSKSIYMLLLHHGIINEEDKFTAEGLKYIKTIAKII